MSVRRRESRLIPLVLERSEVRQSPFQLTLSPSATSSRRSERTPQHGLSARPSEPQWGGETGPQRRELPGTGRGSFSQHRSDVPQLLHTVDVPQKVCPVESHPGQMSGMMVIQVAHSSGGGGLWTGLNMQLVPPKCFCVLGNWCQWDT